MVHSHSNPSRSAFKRKNLFLFGTWQVSWPKVSLFIRPKSLARNDLLISDMDMADAMADYLVKSDVVLMRGHGATLCGRTLPEAVYRAIYAELNAQS